MRLDKHLHQCLGISRSQASQLLKTGRISVNNLIIKSGAHHVTEQDLILLDGEPLDTPGEKHYYFMLHMPR